MRTIATVPRDGSAQSAQGALDAALAYVEDHVEYLRSCVPGGAQRFGREVEQLMVRETCVRVLCCTR